jgi:hypothetical protein
MASADGRKGVKVKTLEKAINDFEKARERMEISKARYEADLKRFKLMEAEKIEAENMEIVKIIRGLNLTIPELHDFREKMKTMLPGAAYAKEEQNESENFKDTY